ncbi:ABC transporter substrate-binding protein [Paenibacillus urinalis]|uniref:ABC transporter substrate-binding protein n=1 Tax=Paenibacillus urinalis TaxID=521520 RepID=A0ABY7XA63_9BACL|nr:ABC transporter substrate-binding protein [Paenibacillus urinalis]WDH98993.1 ABC transporter substrate-binding protein [Paenibacillus urinalis]WDI02687.1 ABC transporter substrate-binding protein [Paenibacillus urinalis]
MKKLLSVMLASAVLLTACGGGGGESESGQSAETNEITVWAWDPAFNIAAMNKAKEAYAEVNPDVTVNIVENAQNDIVQKLNTGLNSGSTKGLPNIVLIEDYRAQSFLQSYPDAFYELTDVINAEDFADYKIGPTSVDGKQYGVPFDSGVTGMYVRTDYLEQAGYTLEDLQDIDWKQYIEIGKDVKEKTGKAMLTQDPNDLGIIRMMIQSAGSWYTAEDGSTPAIADNAAMKTAFETYKEMMDSGIVKVISDWSQFVGGMNSGEVASVPTGNWITPSIKAEASQSGQWAVAPLPTLPGVEGSVHASNLGGSSWYVMNVDGKEAAAEFLKQTFGSDVDLYQTLNTDVGVIGTFKAAAEGEAYKAEDEFFQNQKVVSDFAAWTEQIPNVNYGLNTYAIEDILVVAMQSYLGGQDLDAVLADAQTQAETQIR